MQRAASLALVVVLSLFLGCRSTGAQTPQPATRPASLRVMSFNVRNSNAADMLDHWKFRKDLFFQTIRDFNPDLLGTQEVLADQYDEIAKRLADYAIVGVARDDGKRKGEWSAVLFRKDRFDLLDSGTFWLSETPDVVGSKAWDAALTRICSWARLRDRATGKEFLYANTHFDHKGNKAREESAKLLARKLPELSKGAPVILTGDFNATEDGSAYASFTRPSDAGQLKFSDSYREVHPNRVAEESSFNGFKGTTKGSRIDWILHTAELTATKADIVRTHSPEGRFPSDHYPVTATLEWK